jgi:hypothetical protein
LPEELIQITKPLGVEKSGESGEFHRGRQLYKMLLMLLIGYPMQA